MATWTGETGSEREDTEVLTERARGGDRGAFDELARRHRPGIESIVRRRLGKRLKSQLTLEDVLQETLLRALFSIERFRWQGEGSFQRWVNAIALRVILEGSRSASSTSAWRGSRGRRA